MLLAMGRQVLYPSGYVCAVIRVILLLAMSNTQGRLGMIMHLPVQVFQLLSMLQVKSTFNL